MDDKLDIQLRHINLASCKRTHTWSRSSKLYGESGSIGICACRVSIESIQQTAIENGFRVRECRAAP